MTGLSAETLKKIIENETAPLRSENKWLRETLEEIWRKSFPDRMTLAELRAAMTEINTLALHPQE